MRLIVAVLLSACAYGQVTWRMMPGDDPRWSSPSFDDSGWQRVAPPHYTSQTAEPHAAGVRWYRAEFPVDPGWRGHDLALGLPPIEDAFEVFIEGVKAGQFGSWDPKPIFFPPRHLSFPVTRAAIRGSVAHVALRRWSWGGRASAAIMVANGMNVFHAPAFGLAETVTTLEELHALRALEGNAFALFTHFIMLVCGVLCFGIFRYQRNRREYLWLGLFLVLRGAPGLLAVPAGVSFSMPQLSPFALLIQSAAQLPLLPLFWCLAHLVVRFRWLLRLCGIALAITGLTTIATLAAGSELQYQLLSATLWLRGACVLIAFVAAILGGHQKRSDSMLLSGGLVIATALATWRIQVVQLVTGNPALRRIPWGPLDVDPSDVGSLILSAIVLVVVWTRYQKEQRQQAALQTELAAAREVQKVLLGRDALATPGFRVNAVYRPAQEVGGDFYQIVPAEDGSLLVVIGDVSGKGLQAAMLVSSIMGSLRNQVSRKPAEVLRLLNRSLQGQTRGGFVTCCAALFHAGGRVEIASAGHLPPYVDGKEIALETGIPLGIAADTTWLETSLRFDTGAFTLLSDGVVEARSPKGELHGFERTCGLAARSAAEVADAAQAFGQDDDITVVTVERLTKAAYAA